RCVVIRVDRYNPSNAIIVTIETWGNPMLKILLVDDHEVVRLGLRALLSRYPKFQVVAEASNASEAVARSDEHQPDVVVMDIRLPGKSGIEATREIVQQHP